MLLLTMLILATPLFVYVVWQVLGLMLSIVAYAKWQRRSVELGREGRVAILYPTCDDFNPSAVSTLLNQEKIVSDLFILDDSTEICERARIDEWVKNQDHSIKILRRSNREGYKGGNLDNWFRQYGNPDLYPYVLVMDSDEHIPSEFTYKLQTCLSPQYAFVQANHIGTASLSTLFQSLLHLGVECGWLQDCSRNVFGSPTILGHGVLIRTDCLVEIGGFPKLVSEDIALTILLAEKGFTGVIAPDVIGYEEFPKSYRAYWRRRRRNIQADTDVVRKLLKNVWRSPRSRLARLDLTLREFQLPVTSSYWILLMVVALASIFYLQTNFELPAFSWLLTLLLLLPVAPALFVQRLNIVRRLLFILVHIFVALASRSINPIATIQGIVGRQQWIPTGSQNKSIGNLSSLYVFWELLSGLIFIAGGIASSNLCLTAVGLAISSSPLLRSKYEVQILIVGAIIFWVLIIYQIYIDISLGVVPIEHLLVLV